MSRRRYHVQPCLYRFVRCALCRVEQMCVHWDFDLRGRVCPACATHLCNAEDVLIERARAVAPTDQFLNQHQ